MLGSLYLPDGSNLQRMIFLPERGLVPALSVPEKVKDCLAVGLALELARVAVVEILAEATLTVAIGLVDVVALVDALLANATELTLLT